MMSLIKEIGLGAALMLAIGAAPVILPAQGTQSADITYGVFTANNNVYIAGQVSGQIPGETDFGAYDAFIQAYNQNGKVLWTTQFGTSANDQAFGVAADSTGVYAAGLTDGAFPGFTYGGNGDAFIAKYDLDGNPVWLEQYGNGGVDRLQAATSDGTYLYVTGYTGGSIDGKPNQGGQDCFVQKWSQDGNLEWTNEFGTTGTDRAYGIAVNSTGVFVTGRTDGSFPGNTSIGGLDGFLAEFDFNGNIVFIKQFGTTSDDRGWGIALDTTGIYITGRTEGAFPGQTYKGDDDAYVIKFDFSGNEQWVSEFGTERFDRGTAIATDSTGAYGVGYTQGTLPPGPNYGSTDCYVRKFSTAGAEMWSVQFGSTQYDACWGAATDSTGLYVGGTAGGELAGQTGAPKTIGYFIQKFDQNGNLLWVREISVPQPGS